VLKICNDFADEYDVKLNSNKSVAMRIENPHDKIWLATIYSLYAHWNILV